MPTSSLLDSAVLSEADATSPRFGWKTDRISDGHGGLDETGRPVGDVSAWLFVVQSSNSMVYKLPLLYPHRVLTRTTSWASPFSLYSLDMILLMFFLPTDWLFHYSPSSLC